MLSSAEQTCEEILLSESIAMLNAGELWAPEKFKPLWKLSPSFSEKPWIVELALARRRREVERKNVVNWVENQAALENVFKTERFDDFSAYMAGIPKLLEEYDQLQLSPESPLRFLEGKDGSNLTDVERDAIRRRAKLWETFQEEGIDIVRREELISLLTEFNLAFSEGCLTMRAIGSSSCELLEPTASYLSKPSIHNSFVTRYFVMCYLTKLQAEVAPRAKYAGRAKAVAVPAVILGLAICDYANLTVSSLMLTGWVIIAIILIESLSWLRWIFAGAKAHTILSRLLTYFETIGEPSKCDGRELTKELSALEALKIDVPTLLYPLFRMVLPGY